MGELLAEVPQREGRPASGSWFGPSAARRCAASTELSPAMTEVIAVGHVAAEQAQVSRPL